jgi:DNA-binding transcriptional MerR regulator
MTHHPWTDPELTMIERLAGEIPFSELVEQFHVVGSEQGWPPRTSKAIHQRLIRSGLYTHPTVGNTLTTGGVAQILGIHQCRVDSWLRRRGVAEILQPRGAGRIRYFNRADWRRLAQQRPEILGGFSADALERLLEDRSLAQHVATTYPQPPGLRGVRCVETGRVWPSQQAAARELFVTQAAISLSICRGRSIPSLGLRFEALRAPRGNLRNGATAAGSIDA